ncbi:MAG: cation:proton antiporter [Pseudomonadota bacterium]
MSLLIGTNLSGPLAWGAVIAAMLILAGVICTLYRLVVGKTLPDRVVALDLLSMLLTALLVLFSLAVEEGAYLDAALAMALVSFLATVAFARYVERRDGRRPKAGQRIAKPGKRIDG